MHRNAPRVTCLARLLQRLELLEVAAFVCVVLVQPLLQAGDHLHQLCFRLVVLCSSIGELHAKLLNGLSQSLGFSMGTVLTAAHTQAQTHS